MDLDQQAPSEAPAWAQESTEAPPIDSAPVSHMAGAETTWGAAGEANEDEGALKDAAPPPSKKAKGEPTAYSRQGVLSGVEIGLGESELYPFTPSSKLPFATICHLSKQLAVTAQLAQVPQPAPSTGADSSGSGSSSEPLYHFIFPCDKPWQRTALGLKMDSVFVDIFFKQASATAAGEGGPFEGEPTGGVKLSVHVASSASEKRKKGLRCLVMRPATASDILGCRITSSPEEAQALAELSQETLEELAKDPPPPPQPKPIGKRAQSQSQSQSQSQPQKQAGEGAAAAAAATAGEGEGAGGGRRSQRKRQAANDDFFYYGSASGSASGSAADGEAESSGALAGKKRKRAGDGDDDETGSFGGGSENDVDSADFLAGFFAGEAVPAPANVPAPPKPPRAAGGSKGGGGSKGQGSETVIRKAKPATLPLSSSSGAALSGASSDGGFGAMPADFGGFAGGAGPALGSAVGGGEIDVSHAISLGSSSDVRSYLKEARKDAKFQVLVRTVMPAKAKVAGKFDSEEEEESKGGGIVGFFYSGQSGMTAGVDIGLRLKTYHVPCSRILNVASKEETEEAMKIMFPDLCGDKEAEEEHHGKGKQEAAAAPTAAPKGTASEDPSTASVTEAPQPAAEAPEPAAEAVNAAAAPVPVAMAAPELPAADDAAAAAVAGVQSDAHDEVEGTL